MKISFHIPVACVDLHMEYMFCMLSIKLTLCVSLGSDYLEIYYYDRLCHWQNGRFLFYFYQILTFIGR